MRNGAFSFVAFGFAFALAAPAFAADSRTARPAAAAPDSPVVHKLKVSLAESLQKLGEIEPWQRRIFDEEALPQYQRFIRDYRSSQVQGGATVSGFEVDIDTDSLRNYLKFYAPKSLGRDEKTATALVYLRASSDCARCIAAEPQIHHLAEMRLERRGLQPSWLSAEDLGAGADGTGLEGKPLEDKVTELAASRGAAAALVLQWGPAPADDVDSAHADEKHFLLRSFLLARGLAGTGKLAGAAQTLGVANGSADLLDEDSFETAAGKLLADAFVDLGAQAQRAELAAAARGGAGLDDSEIDLDVSGLHGFTQLSQLKTQIQAKFAAASVQERKITRGRVWLALVGAKTAPDAVRTQLSGLSIDPAVPGSPRLTSAPSDAGLGGGGTAPASQPAPPVLAWELKP